MININLMRKKNQPTVPVTLQDELATNPFLRADNRHLQEKINLLGKTEIEVFTRIRKLKDHF
jgi:hydroxyacylglutathione hydrolase